MPIEQPFTRGPSTTSFCSLISWGEDNMWRKIVKDFKAVRESSLGSVMRHGGGCALVKPRRWTSKTASGIHLSGVPCRKTWTKRSNIIPHYKGLNLNKKWTLATSHSSETTYLNIPAVEMLQGVQRVNRRCRIPRISITVPVTHKPMQERIQMFPNGAQSLVWCFMRSNTTLMTKQQKLRHH